MSTLRVVIRAALRELGPVAAIILALSVGIGASTAVFAFMDHLWLVPLPYGQPERIVRVWEIWPSNPTERPLGLSWPKYRTLAEASETIEQIALYSGGLWDVGIVGTDTTERIQLGLVTPQFFPLLGVRPIAGRWLEWSDGGQRVREAVVSERFWQRFFGGQELTGQSLRIGENNYPIIGIMPNRFAMPDSDTRVWVSKPPPPPQQAESQYSQCLARKREGVSDAQVEAEIARFFDSQSPRVLGLWEATFGELSTPMGWLGWGIAVVFLIGLLNATTLQFARLSRRWKDFGIRAALGAGSLRLAAELIVEGLVLTLVGGGLGFVAFSMAFDVVSGNWPGGIPGLHDFSLWSLRPLLLLGLETLMCAIVMGALSLWFVQRIRAMDRLHPGRDGTLFAGFPIRLNGTLVSGQLTAAVVLLICAGMLTHSFIAALMVDLGYEPEGLLTADFRLPSERYPTVTAQYGVLGTWRERLEAVEGVVSVGFSNVLPSVAGAEMTIGLSPEQPERRPKVAWAQVSPGFFQAMRLHIRQGSLFSDPPPSEPSVVVNESLARTYLGADPIGRSILLPPKQFRVIGVVSDVLQDGYLGRSEPGLYFHVVQPPNESFVYDITRGWLVLRVKKEPMAYAGIVRDSLRSIDPRIRLTDVQTMDHILSEQFAQPRFWTLLALSLSGLGLAFSMIAVYALMSYTVTQRIPELAVRMTLGATPIDIRRLVLRNAAAIVGKGLLAGLIIALIVANLFADLLFGIVRLPALTWILCLALLALVGLAASYFPARRGTQVEPSTCLKAG